MDIIFKLFQTATFTFILSKENFLFVAVGEIPGDTTGVALQFCFFLNTCAVSFLFLSFLQAGSGSSAALEVAPSPIPYLPASSCLCPAPLKSEGLQVMAAHFILCSYSHSPQALLQLILRPFIVITVFLAGISPSSNSSEAPHLLC